MTGLNRPHVCLFFCLGAAILSVTRPVSQTSVFTTAVVAYSARRLAAWRSQQGFSGTEGCNWVLLNESKTEKSCKTNNYQTLLLESVAHAGFSMPLIVQ